MPKAGEIAGIDPTTAGIAKAVDIVRPVVKWLVSRMEIACPKEYQIAGAIFDWATPNDDLLDNLRGGIRQMRHFVDTTNLVVCREIDGEKQYGVLVADKQGRLEVIPAVISVDRHPARKGQRYLQIGRDRQELDDAKKYQQTRHLGDSQLTELILLQNETSPDAETRLGTLVRQSVGVAHGPVMLLEALDNAYGPALNRSDLAKASYLAGRL